jgi:ubiquinone/menaquinone biosynthesis C-methylase UbiE
MEFEQLRSNWEAWGRTDPLFAILTNNPEKRHGGWDLGEFFATGRKQVDEQMSLVRGLAGAPNGGRMLDFGCGVGRLTQAFCRHFDECDGVDVAGSMIEQAVRLNRYGDRCRYHVNASQDLRLFPENTFDFVYTSAVLQHMAPIYAKSYIREFLRVLKPEGMASFELPSHVAVAEPLPPASFRAQITPVEVPPAMRAGVPTRLRARVCNQSDETWPSFGRNEHGPDLRNYLNLGNHWVDESGELVVVDDGRAPLTEALPPGADCTMSLEVRPPGRPGRYVLELDMVQEGFTWFGDRGSPTARVSVRVDPPHGRLGRLARLLGRPRRNAPDSGGEPIMEMHCVPKSEVLDVIAECGGNVVHLEEMHGSHHGYRYYVRR